MNRTIFHHAKSALCLLLALVVMLQKPKEGGLGGLAGGMGEAVFGADAGNVLIKVTVWLGVIFLVNTLILARFTSKPTSSLPDVPPPSVSTEQPKTDPIAQAAEAAAKSEAEKTESAAKPETAAKPEAVKPATAAKPEAAAPKKDTVPAAEQAKPKAQ